MVSLSQLLFPVCLLKVIGIVTRKDLARYKFFRHNGHCGVVELGMSTN